MISGQLVSSLFETALLLFIGRELLDDWRHMPPKILHCWLFTLLMAALCSVIISPWINPTLLPVWPQSAAIDPLTQQAAASHAPGGIFSMLFKTYLAGTIALLCLWGASLARLVRLHRRALPVEDAYWLSELATLSGRRVGLVVSELIQGPMTWGMFRPVIAIPPKALRWPRTHIRWALLHETAHVDNRDWFTQQLCRLSCILFWPIPTSWQILRDLCQEAEIVADNRVLASGAAPPEYAAWLLQQARGVRCSPAVALAPSSNLEARFRCILGSRRRSTRQPTSPLLAGLAAGLLLSLPLAHLQFSTLEVLKSKRAAISIPLRTADEPRPAPGQALIERLESPLNAKLITVPTPPPPVPREPRYPPSAAPP